MTRWVLVVCAVAGSGLVAAADTAKRKPKDALPPGVTMVARSAWNGGASPDGSKFAHFTGSRSRQLRIVTVDTGVSVTIKTEEKSCSDSACLDNRCSRVEWSHDGARVAMRTDDGLWEVDVGGESRRRVDTDANLATCTFRFAADGPLEWLGPGVKGTALWRDGETESVVELPSKANAHEIGDTVVVTGRYATSGVTGWSDLWIVDRTHRKMRRLYRRDDGDPDDRMWEPKLSPDESRVCWMDGGVRCALTRNGKTEVIATAAGTSMGRWGHERTVPFSPSGKLLAFRVATEGGGDTLMVHDFTSGKTKDVLAPMRHKDYTFQGEDLVLLYEQEDWRDRTIPAIARVDVRDGTETAVVSAPETQYNAPIVLPGRTDVVFIGRERGGSRDLVRVDIDAAIKGAE
jgi:hypothetical protein